MFPSMSSFGSSRASGIRLRSANCGAECKSLSVEDVNCWREFWWRVGAVVGASKLFPGNVEAVGWGRSVVIGCKLWDRDVHD